MRRLDALCCAGLVLLTALALAPLTLLGRIPTSYDTEASYAPYAVFAHSQLVHGHLPLWNPYAFAGQPFAGDTGTGTFYPPWSLALAFLSPAHGLALVLWLHFALAAVGAFLLARAAGGSRFAGLLAGIGFGLSSLLFARVQSLSLLEAAAWVPWCLAGALVAARPVRLRGVSVVCLGAPLGLLLLTGVKQLPVVTGLACVLILVRARGWSGLGRAALGTVLAGGIAAAALLPASELVAHAATAGTVTDLRGHGR